MTGLSPALVDYPLDALVSFHYYRSDKAMDAVVGTKRLRIIGDSGAFSAFTQGTPIKMPEYVAWCRQWGPYLTWMAALDVIGDPAATLANWREMRDRHQLITVPTLHVGTDPGWLDAYVKDGVDFFGLGGMVGRAMPSLPWVVKVFRYVRDRHPHVRFHIWGITNRQFLDNLPAYSADSSGILGAPYRFAVLRLFDPRTGKHVNVPLKGNGVFKAGPLMRQVYGVDPATVTRSTPATRNTLIQLAARATQLYARWLQRRHQVSAPTWAVKVPAHLEPPTAPDTGVGVRLHCVSASTGGHDDPDRALGEYPGATYGGTRVHCVDGSAANLVMAAEGGSSTRVQEDQ